MKINIKEKQFNFLITCYHTIKKKYIDSKININVFYEKEEKEENINIELDRNKRFIRCYNFLDTTLIKIMNKDNIPEDKYLFPDFNYKNGYNHYENIQIFTAGYPENYEHKGEIFTSAWVISKINEIDFEHTYDSEKGSSGSPLINFNRYTLWVW